MTEEQLAARRPYMEQKQPSMKRRSDINNYHGRHIYMVTLATEGRRPWLAQVSGSSEQPVVMPTRLGLAVKACWEEIARRHPEVKLLAFQLMPDHLHGILFVQSEMQMHLGQVISGFKAGCNKAFRQLQAEAAPPPTHSQGAGGEGKGKPEGEDEGKTREEKEGENERKTQRGSAYEAAPPLPLPSQCRLKKDDKRHGLLFERGYNDLIAKDFDMLPRLIAYVKDNPRRLLVRREHPDYFRVRFGLTIAGQTYAAIGNRFLLYRPEKLQVQLSRRLTDEEIAHHVARFTEAAHNGAVLVSPAISKGEQAVMRQALNDGLPLIFLTPWGFNTFSKPGHQYFEACAEGRLLMLAPWEHQNERVDLSRAMCMALNEMSRQICDEKTPPK
ncbi:MAG: hypothetical protein IKH22_02075 [Prevotella sp.]|nr:hypothetical protein [Prevotella sp.]